MKVREIHVKYILGTAEKAPVVHRTFLVAHLPAVLIGEDHLGIIEPKVRMSTLALKHIYDKRPAEEYECVLDALSETLEHPKYVYRNPSGKRGNLCIVSIYKNQPYAVSIECLSEETAIDGLKREPGNYVATCFRQRDKNYFKKYELLWSWEDGVSSS